MLYIIMKHKLYFLTFANTKYMNTNRIIEQAKNFNVFDEILSLNENNIKEYINKHKEFIENNNIGYGLWIWKPKIILDTLNKINYNDILIYCDAGTYLNSNGIERFNEYLSQLINTNKSLLVFSNNDSYKSQYYVKNDAIMSYYPEFNNKFDIYCYAGVMIIKKNIESINLISEWLSLCENHHFIDRSNSTEYTDFPYYIGNDCDNGLFNLCLSKHNNILIKIYPDEINLYIGDKQVVHTDVDLKTIDWNKLDKIPFQVRRMTPKFGYN